MNRCKLISVVLLITFVQGCAYISARSSNLLEKIDLLVEQQYYGQAQAILSKVPTSHPDYSQVLVLTETVDKQAKAYEQQALAEGDELEQAGRWQVAIEHYEQALSLLPSSEPLTQALQALQLKRDQRVATLELNQLIAQGEWLRQRDLTREELMLITPSSWFKARRQEDAQRESKKVAVALGKEGELALAQGELLRAQKILDLAWQLDPTPEIETARKNLVTQQEQVAANKLRSQVADQQKQRQAVMNSRKHMRKILQGSFQQALADRELSDALDYIARLKLLGELDEDEQQLVQQLEFLIEKQVNEGLNLGVEHYGLGEYQEAIASWQRVLEVDPENRQAQAHITRAERILEKLQRLRDSKKE